MCQIPEVTFHVTEFEICLGPPINIHNCKANFKAAPGNLGNLNSVQKSFDVMSLHYICIYVTFSPYTRFMKSVLTDESVVWYFQDIFCRIHSKLASYDLLHWSTILWGTTVKSVHIYTLLFSIILKILVCTHFCRLKSSIFFYIFLYLIYRYCIFASWILTDKQHVINLIKKINSE